MKKLMALVVYTILTICFGCHSRIDEKMITAGASIPDQQEIDSLSCETLKEWKVQDENIMVARVAGSFEAPYGCIALLKKEPKLDALIALGCIIKGETDHDKYLATSVTDALMRISLDYKIPVASGILTVNSLEQAVARTVGDMNRGRESAIAALQSALL